MENGSLDFAKLPDAVAKEYELTEHVSHTHYWGAIGGNVNLNVLSVQEAQALVDGGFPYIRKKEKKENGLEKAVDKTK